MSDNLPELLAQLTPEERGHLAALAQNLIASRGEDWGAFCALLGMRFEIVEPGHARGEMPVSPALFNRGMVAQGGAVFAFADQLMGTALYAALPDGAVHVSLEIKINYIAAVRQGPLVGEGKWFKRGRRIVHMQAEVRDQTGGIVAAAMGTFYILDDGAGR
jgi:uncharacterized protein (TIGR00369 family)